MLNKEPMYMQDYIDELDKILKATDRDVLIGSGKISHEQAIEKATSEYRKYQNITLSPVGKAYLDSILTT
ncbi:MAG: RhuM family protein [Candidatus Scatosoma sp.]